MVRKNVMARSAHIGSERIVSKHRGRIQEVKKEGINGIKMSYIVIDFPI